MQSANAKARIVESQDFRSVSDSLWTYAVTGSVVMVLLFGGLAGWAATTRLAGAIVAQGTLVVDSNIKKVQHPSGGVVGEILVRDGDKISAGQVLIRLDDTVTRANLQIVKSQLDEAEIRTLRLEAERDGQKTLSALETMHIRLEEKSFKKSFSDEVALFQSRSDARNGQKSQLRERIAQLRQEIEGIEGQQKSKRQEIDLVQKELVGLLDLQSKDLIPVTRVLSVQRESARLHGEEGQLKSSSAQLRGKIAEIELQIIQIEQDLRTEVMKELRETHTKRAELIERAVAAEDQLRRIDIRAPRDGIVHQMAVHTIGGVINQGEVLLIIVPEEDELVVEARIAPQDIEQVRMGQSAFLRLTAFDQSTTPELAGEVIRVSADISREEQTGQTFFVARINVAQSDAPKIRDLKLKPGMPAEVHIRTTERTALGYFSKPLRDQIARAFNER